MKNPYLMDSRHWRVEGAFDYTKVFPAMLELLPLNSILGLAQGDLSPEGREFMIENSIKLDPVILNSLPQGSFEDAFFIPVDRKRMFLLAGLADHHAEPEIALHMVGIGNGLSLLEWFDAPDDPISISLKLTEPAVEHFAQSVGATFKGVADGVL